MPAGAHGRIHSEADTGSSCSVMTQHLTTSAVDAVWRADHLSLFLLCFSLTHRPYSLLPAIALIKTLGPDFQNILR